jgi:hypothetical protein
MTAPIKVDTETFSDQFDFKAFARNLLSGQAGVGALPGDIGPLDWLERALPLIEGTPYRERLTRAIAECLTDSETSVRREALRFFEKFPDAPGAERITRLAHESRQLFAEKDLESALLHAVGARMKTNDQDAVAFGRAEALREGGRPDSLLAALTCFDTDWVGANAIEIVRKHPRTATTILFNLEQSARDVGDLGEALAPVAAAADHQFRREVQKFLRKGPALERILAATQRRKR